MMGKQLYAHIKALMVLMEEGKQEKFLEEAEEEGFLKWRATLMPVSPSLDIYTVTTAHIFCNSISIPLKILRDSKEDVETLGLIDSRAGGKFIDQNYARKTGLNIQKLDEPLKAFNVDGTENKRGTITGYVNLDLEINEKKEITRLLVTGRRLYWDSPG